MSKQEDFRRPEKPLEETREIDNEARISNKAEMARKFNRNQKRITLWDIHLSSLTSLLCIVLCIQLFNHYVRYLLTVAQRDQLAALNKLNYGAY